MAAHCSSQVETVASLTSKGCIFGGKKLHASAPVFRALGIASDSLTLVNPVEDGDCGAQMMKMIMIAMGHASPNPRRRIFELVRARHLFPPAQMSMYERSLTPPFGTRFLELWEILLLCEDIRVNPIVLAMAGDLGRNQSHQYMKYTFNFEDVPDGGRSWPIVVIAMTQKGKHFEAVAKKLHGRGDQTALCFTFSRSEGVRTEGSRQEGFIEGGNLSFHSQLAQASAQDMRLYVTYKPPRGSLLDGSKDAVTLNPDTLDIVTDDHDDQFIVVLSEKASKDITDKLRARGRVSAGSGAAGPKGRKAAASSGKRPKSPPPPSGSSGKRPRPPSPRIDEDDDPDLAAAIAMSLGTAGAPRAPSGQGGMDEDERQLQLAIQRSLYGRGMLFRPRRSLGRARAR